MLRVLLILSFALFTASAYAQDDGEGEEGIEEGAAETAEAGEDGQVVLPNTGSIYIPLKPEFVVNYGGAGKLKYLKADISVRLRDGGVANSVRHHMPFIRNNLVMLFSAQSDETLSSQDGKEALRQEALKEVQEVLMTEDRQDGVIDLYFNSLIIQK